MEVSDSFSSTEHNNTSQGSQEHSEHGHRSTSGHRFSLGQTGSPVTSDSGAGGRRLSAGFAPYAGGSEGQGTGTFREGRDFSRRGNIHRSHLSSSIQTGKSFGGPWLIGRRNTSDKSTFLHSPSADCQFSGIGLAKNIFRTIAVKTVGIDCSCQRHLYPCYTRSIPSNTNYLPQKITSSHHQFTST